MKNYLAIKLSSQQADQKASSQAGRMQGTVCSPTPTCTPKGGHQAPADLPARSDILEVNVSTRKGLGKHDRKPAILYAPLKEWKRRAFSWWEKQYVG